MYYDFNCFRLNSNEQCRKALLDEIIRYDYQFYLSYNRLQYLVAKKRKRTIISEYGFITYSRRIYRDRFNNSSICFTDLHFGIDKKQRVMFILKEIIFSQIASKKTIQDIKDTIPYAPISKVTIGIILSRGIITGCNFKKKDKLSGESNFIY